MRRRSSSMRSTGVTTPILAIAREDVIGQKVQRVAFRTGREPAERPLGALHELDSRAVGVVDRTRVAEQRTELTPLLERGAAGTDNPSDQRARLRIAAGQQVND